MKKPKHTNGPWLITTIDGEDCLMVGGGDGSEVVADIRTHQPESEVEANAHLISSAPEMLAALLKIAKEIETVPPEYGLGGDALLGAVNHICDEAIAHAEGRPSHILKLLSQDERFMKESNEEAEA